MFKKNYKKKNKTGNWQNNHTHLCFLTIQQGSPIMLSTGNSIRICTASSWAKYSQSTPYLICDHFWHKRRHLSDWWASNFWKQHFWKSCWVWKAGAELTKLTIVNQNKGSICKSFLTFGWSKPSPVTLIRFVIDLSLSGDMSSPSKSKSST